MNKHKTTVHTRCPYAPVWDYYTVIVETPDFLRSNYEATYAKQREKAFQRSIERERRLETLDMLLKTEVAELEKEFCRRVGISMEQTG